ncbi:hypothetical protein [Actinomadura sp. GTD37]|uniref:hypothetical protein n=1 Tax=Actinomadura sp. GTD37 TaxID=1778030 RepID=UPI0035BEEDED
MRSITVPVAAGLLGAALTGTLVAGVPAASAGTTTTTAAKAAPAASAPLGQSAWRCRTATSTITGAKVTGKICWSGKNIKVSGMMYDTKGDSRRAGVKIHVVNVRGVARTPYHDWIDNSKPGKKESWGDSTKGSKYWFKACVRNWRSTKCANRWS